MTSVTSAAGVSVTLGDAVGSSPVLDRLLADGVPRSLTRGNTRLWGPDAEPDAARSLGWLGSPTASRTLLPLLDDLADPALDRVVLAGVGEASAAARALAGGRITVLDTTDPHQVGRVVSADLSRTRAVVADRRGTALETDALRRILEHAFRTAGLDPAERIVVVTEPGSALAAAATAGGHAMVAADPQAAGPYAALTAFGLVPAALAGVDVAGVLSDAAALAPLLSQPYENPGPALGAALAGVPLLGLAGGPPGLARWVEYLLATSLGKSGRGLLPVVTDGPTDPGFAAAGPGRRVLLAADGAAARARTPGLVVAGPLGAQFLLWQYATAVAARVLGVNPFDQPGVAEAQDTTAGLLRGAEDGELPTLIMGEPALSTATVQVHGPREMLRGARDLAEVFDALLAAVPPDGYLAICAFLDEIGEERAAELRPLLVRRARRIRRAPLPVTFGWGPGHLHTTGQLHRFGPPGGVFLQLTGEAMRDVQVPGQPYGLRHLQLAQAFADLRSLRSRGRPAVRLHLASRAEGLSEILDALSET